MRYTCTVCNIEKDEGEFQTYFHSKQQKLRRRRECTECFYRKRRERKKARKQLEIEKRKKKYCNRCKEWYYLEDYYGTTPTGELKKFKSKYVYCHNCRKETYQKYKKKYKKHMDPDIGNIPNEPNTYSSEAQREATFAVMERLGFTFNKKTGIWWKDGYRDKKGNFLWKK